TLRIMIGLGLAHDRFAEDVHREGNSLLVRSAEHDDDLAGIIAQHELPGHPGDLALDACSEEPGSATGGFHGQTQSRREIDRVIAKILFEMPSDLARRG